MKYSFLYLFHGVIKSPSSRGRGLKYKSWQKFFEQERVALFTRAWIEILPVLRLFLLLFVALFTRAWIEILIYALSAIFHNVALFTRAWIEITRADFLPDNLVSPSSRGRGLKWQVQR